MQKLLFAGRDFKFMTDIIDFFESDPNFEVKFDHWKGKDRHNEEESRNLLQWADIIIAEWCLGNAVWYSKNKLEHQKLFIRLHRQEIKRNYLYDLKIKNINKLVFIAPHIKEEVEQKISLPADKSTLIYNTTNVTLLNKQKVKDSMFHIGMLGFHTKRKRPDKVIEIFEKLKQIDNRYTLHFKGKHPSDVSWVWKKEAQREYFKKLFERIEASPYKDSIIFDDFGSDVDEWFRNIGFILSTSDHEGSHQAVSEGMASGSIPMITGWEGPERMYPPEYVKYSTDDIVKAILVYRNNEKQFSAKQKEVVNFCYKHFDTDIICRQWLELITNS
ncbi:glycosyltransferase [Anaerobacillus alkaliphilus]|uniref:Glycosyltransferase n=1 Tax=Anaerobacillus alkaliphilus TaxID=1548597 RepID=A0A4Q0VQ36_9BACI|nr:glycosyltransferase [Anaerobacillus alkaliphilus]RXI96465.1 glycosyltransferase [Anaerobacillus alkaliphilus]